LERTDLRDPWLVACWPGMGSVALLAGHYLAQALGAREVGELAAGEFFDITNVKVKEGVLQQPRAPRNAFWSYRNPGAGPDLLVFLGEAQPVTRGWAFCQELMAEAQRHGVRRVVTFAAMAMPMTPGTPSRVFAVATGRSVLAELPADATTRLQDGEIGGLNGVLLAAAAERGIDGLCLLGSFPFLAPGVPNPSASAAVLRVFRQLARLSLDTAELEERGREVDTQLARAVEQLQDQARQRAETGDEDEVPFASVTEKEEEREEEERKLPREDRDRIERLFGEAQTSRDKAVRLKAELDRLGVFKRYEDRFLDLFKRGE
jgi:predicted ATP-grasp superfamily ATP-dependent carboligase